MPVTKKTRSNLPFFLTVGFLAVIAGFMFNFLELSFLEPSIQLWIFVAISALIGLLAGIILKHFDKQYKSQKDS